MPSSHLTAHDLHALARAFLDLPWQTDGLNPAIQLLLTHFDANRTDEVRTLRRLLGPEILQQILAVDPHAPMPEPPQRNASLAIVPELPASACLSESQQAETASVGRWLDDYIAWAGAAANETPLTFHTGAGLYLAAVAVGRRLYVQTPWRQQVFPNLYLMLVAVSTYYRKSAGLSLAAELARMSIPHMLLPQPGSPENFLAMLGGVLPPNFSEIPPQDRARLEKGNTFAAQRGLMRDELSGLFKSMGRDFMAGLKELIMTLYDCPPYLDNNTNNKGLVVIRDAALSILGAATPAELSAALSVGDWYNGNLARFALLTPELDYRERPAATQSDPPVALALRLQRLHERLPAPPQPDAFGERRSAEVWALTAPIWPFCLAYEQALRAMTAPGSSLDDRLRAIYGRLHVQALKIAILLAALDWAELDSDEKPIVTPAHWFRAQRIVEDWRASAHRLLASLGESEEARLEDRVLSFLRAQSQPVSARDIYRSLHATRKPVVDALAALQADGSVLCLPASDGTRSERYQLLQPY